MATSLGQRQQTTYMVLAVQPPHDSQLRTANKKASLQWFRRADHPFLVFHHRVHHEQNRLQGRVVRRRESTVKRDVPREVEGQVAEGELDDSEAIQLEMLGR